MGIEKIAMRFHINFLNTGNYVNLDYECDYIIELEPTQQTEIDDIDYKIWFAQIMVWGAINVISKIILFFCQRYLTIYLEVIAIVLLGWMNHFPKVKLVLVMIIIPLILNSIQFWIQDNILKAKKEKNIEF